MEKLRQNCRTFNRYRKQTVKFFIFFFFGNYVKFLQKFLKNLQLIMKLFRENLGKIAGKFWNNFRKLLGNFEEVSRKFGETILK